MNQKRKARALNIGSIGLIVLHRKGGSRVGQVVLYSQEDMSSKALDKQR